MRNISGLSPLLALAALACNTTNTDCPDGFSFNEDVESCVVADTDGDGWYDS